MILGEGQQEFASPEEALKHYGVKGMRWGHRKEEEASPREVARQNEAEKQQRITELVVGKHATLPNTISDGGRLQPREPNEPRHGLSTQQKVALGVGAAGLLAAGFVAYRAYSGGLGGDKGISFSWSDHPTFRLKDGDSLLVNTSKGYADIRPTQGKFGGFLNEYSQQQHTELLSTLDTFREKYPAIRNMNVEVVPMSHVPGMEGLVASRCPAAVMAGPKGFARLIFNDKMDPMSSDEAEYMKTIQPGQLVPKFIGFHEMGHMLATAHGDLPAATDIVGSESVLKQMVSSAKWSMKKDANHRATLKKHGLTFEDLMDLSPYGATEPAEALAELSGYYHTPGQRGKLSPELQAKAKSLFDDMGGVTS